MFNANKLFNSLTNVRRASVHVIPTRGHRSCLIVHAIGIRPGIAFMTHGKVDWEWNEEEAALLTCYNRHKSISGFIGKQ